MSSSEGEPSGSQLVLQNGKKRRLQRACDVCRRKKIKCNGAQMPNNRCSHCITYNRECTYVGLEQQREKTKGYVETLESRLTRMEKLVKKLCPDPDLLKELDTDSDAETPPPPASAKAARSSYSPPVTIPRAESPGAGRAGGAVRIPDTAEELDPSDDEVMAKHTLVQSLQRLRLNPAAMRFFGKSSSVMLVQTALDAKPAPPPDEGPPREREKIDPYAVPNNGRRMEFWRPHPWLQRAPDEEARPHPATSFPEEDLMDDVIDLYFTNINIYMPLLHRPTFEQQIGDGLHLRDEGFGSTVLLVCAVGARYSDDPRVFLKDYPDNTHSAGWEWFTKVNTMRRSHFEVPRLYDLQICCLTAFFIDCTYAPGASWTVIGIGIRMAQDVGAHRKKVYNRVPMVEEELWKRAFWILVVMDRSISSALGRPCAMQDEDLDLEFPVECDDEYWLNPDPELAFKQPKGKPSKAAFFNCFLRLHQILAFAQRTVYSNRKFKAMVGLVGQNWDEKLVTELDSALNKWLDSVPDHLRWDPSREDIIFFNQSAHLHAVFYDLQIFVHRPFIPSPRSSSPTSFPSLAICTNAARACTHIMWTQYQRMNAALQQGAVALFTCGIVLLLSLWGRKRAGMKLDVATEMADVHKCMDMLHNLEHRWHIAGKMWDVLCELAHVGDLPLPDGVPSRKRPRESETLEERQSSSYLTHIFSPTHQGQPSDNLTTAAQNQGASGTSSLNGQQQAAPQWMQQMGGATTSAQYTNGGAINGPSAFGRTFTMQPPNEPPGGTLYSSLDFAANPTWMNTRPPTLAQTSELVACMTAQAPPEPQYVAPQAAPQATAGYNSGAFDPTVASILAMSDPNAWNSLLTAPAQPQTAPAQMAQTAASTGYSAAQASQTQSNQPPPSAFSDSTLAMWSNVPFGFEWGDWDTYLSAMSDLNNPMGA